jgi:hypothetical protein
MKKAEQEKASVQVDSRRASQYACGLVKNTRSTLPFYSFYVCWREAVETEGGVGVGAGTSSCCEASAVKKTKRIQAKSSRRKKKKRAELRQQRSCRHRKQTMPELPMRVCVCVCVLFSPSTKDHHRRRHDALSSPPSFSLSFALFYFLFLTSLTLSSEIDAWSVPAAPPEGYTTIMSSWASYD